MFVGIVKNTVLFSIYNYNIDLFVTMFCENKERPELQCNGKCYLSKMQKEQDKNDAANTLSQLQAEINYFNASILEFTILFEETFPQKNKQMDFYDSTYTYLHITSIVKPPEALGFSNL